MGSTDIWKPLHCLQLLSDGDAPVVGTDITTLPPRSIFLVSDGHMTEEDPTLDAIRRGIRHSRLFTFGVRCVCGERKREVYLMALLPLSSSAANRHFLRSMARVGAGCEEFFDSKTKSKWERKVKSQLSKAFQPALTSVNVEWQQFDDNAPKPVQVILGAP